MTPAIAAARRARIPFSVHEYAHDPDAPSYGLEAAEKLGVSADFVFKTLVASVDGRLVAALVPVARSPLVSIARPRRAPPAAPTIRPVVPFGRLQR